VEFTPYSDRSFRDTEKQETEIHLPTVAMVTVSKHSQRRVHAYHPAQAPPNKHRGRNLARAEKGLRLKHVHGITGVVELNRAINSHPAKAIYGWLRSRTSTLTSHIARRHGQAGEKSKADQNNEISLKALSQAKHKMQYILADLVPEPGANQTRLHKVNYWALPTTEVVYNNDTGRQDGFEIIRTQLHHLKASDDKFAGVASILDGLSGIYEPR
jgi:hypothetical protein